MWARPTGTTEPEASVCPCAAGGLRKEPQRHRPLLPVTSTGSQSMKKTWYLTSLKPSLKPCVTWLPSTREPSPQSLALPMRCGTCLGGRILGLCAERQLQLMSQPDLLTAAPGRGCSLTESHSDPTKDSMKICILHSCSGDRRDVAKPPPGRGESEVGSQSLSPCWAEVPAWALPTSHLDQSLPALEGAGLGCWP